MDCRGAPASCGRPVWNLVETPTNSPAGEEGPPDDGSTFQFVAGFVVQKPEPQATPRAFPSGTTALLVDDNGTSRRFLEEVLEEWGIETRAAGSAAAGLAALDDLERVGRVCAFAIVDS